MQPKTIKGKTMVVAPLLVTYFRFYRFPAQTIFSQTVVSYVFMNTNLDKLETIFTIVLKSGQLKPCPEQNLLPIFLDIFPIL